MTFACTKISSLENELVQICDPITMSIRIISSPEKIGPEKNMTKITLTTLSVTYRTCYNYIK